MGRVACCQTSSLSWSMWVSTRGKFKDMKSGFKCEKFRDCLSALPFSIYTLEPSRLGFLIILTMQDNTRLRRLSSLPLAFATLALLGVGLAQISGAHASSAMDPSSPSFPMATDDSNTISAASNQSLLWGVYRPNLYFGTRPRLPDSVMTGLMWFGMQDYHGADSKYRQFFRSRNHNIQ